METYKKISMEVIVFESDDIITKSGDIVTPPNSNDEDE